MPPQWLIPREKRPIPANKVVKNILRIIHVLTFGVVFGAYFFDQTYHHLYNVVLAFSGLLMIAREVYRSGVWVFQVRGALTFIKIILLITLIVAGEVHLLGIGLISVIGILSSHLPKTVKKRILIQIDQNDRSTAGSAG